MEYYIKKSFQDNLIHRLYDENNFEDAHINFMNCVKQIVNNENVKMMSEQKLFSSLYSDYIFEGSQGILLDQSHGFFPNVTRCNVTSQNAIEMIKRNRYTPYQYEADNTEIHYVTRCYATRHGAGIFPTEGKILHLIDGLNDKTNFNNDWQQSFRYGCLDLQLLDYALECDNIYSEGITKNIYVTCLDHLKNNNEILCKSIKEVVGYKPWSLKQFKEGFEQRKINNMYTSDNPYSEFQKF